MGCSASTSTITIQDNESAVVKEAYISRPVVQVVQKERIKSRLALVDMGAEDVHSGCQIAAQAAGNIPVVGSVVSGCIKALEFAYVTYNAASTRNEWIDEFLDRLIEFQEELLVCTELFDVSGLRDVHDALDGACATYHAMQTGFDALGIRKALFAESDKKTLKMLVSNLNEVAGHAGFQMALANREVLEDVKENVNELTHAQEAVVNDVKKHEGLLEALDLDIAHIKVKLLEKQHTRICHNVSDPVPAFVGRDAELDEIHKVLSNEYAVTIAGLGGMGKTQVAKRYVQKFGNNYGNIVWQVDCSSVDTIRHSYKELGIYAGLAIDNLSKDELLTTVLAFVCQSDKWLLILDNVDDVTIRTSRDKYLPANMLSGSVIFTSQLLTGWSNKVINLGNLTMEDTLLLWRNHGGDNVETDNTNIQKLYDTLGGHALALSLAHSYCVECGMLVSEYLEEFNAACDEIEEEALDDLKSQTHYSKTSTVAIRQALNRVQGGTPLALQLVQACAHLSNDGIPAALLHAVLGFEHKKRAFHSAMKLCTAHGLLVPDGEARYSIHRLVQRVTLGDMNAETASSIRSRVLNALLEQSAGFDAAVPGTWPDMNNLVAHIAHVREEQGASDMQILTLVSRMANLSRVLGRLDEAIRLNNNVVSALAQAAVPGETARPFHVDVTTNLGIAYFDNGDIDRAMECWSRALGMESSTDRRWMIHIYLARGCAMKAQIEEATKHLDNIVLPDTDDTSKEVLPLRIAYYATKSAIHMARGKYALALVAAQTAHRLNCASDSGGAEPNTPAIVQSYQQLGAIFVKQHDLDSAVSTFKKALNVAQVVYGAERDHPVVAELHQHIGSTLALQKHFGTSLFSLETALMMSIAVFGDREHKKVQAAKLALQTVMQRDDLYQMPKELRLPDTRGMEFVDQTALLNNAGDWLFANELVVDFIKDQKREIPSMRELIAKADNRAWQMLQHKVHAAHGAACNICVRRITKVTSHIKQLTFNIHRWTVNKEHGIKGNTADTVSPQKVAEAIASLPAAIDGYEREFNAFAAYWAVERVQLMAGAEENMSEEDEEEYFE